MKVPLGLAGVGLVWGLSICALGRADAAIRPSLVVVAHSAGESASHPGVYDAGTLDAMKAFQIEHTFTIRNTGAEPVTIDDLTSSCGCTTALVESGSHARSLPFTVPPGRFANIRVEVDLEGEVVGTLEKYVWVHARGQTAPAAVLEVKATLPPLVALTPTTIDFGRVRAESTTERTVYIAVSPRLMADQPVIALGSSLPYVTVGPPTAAGTAPAPSGEAGRWPRLAYTVGLGAKAPIGAFADDLTVELTHVGAMNQVSEQSLDNEFVVVRGEVYGDIWVAPKSVVFGTVQAGSGAVKQITLTAAEPAILAHITVATDSPWVSAALQGDRPSPSSGASSSVYAISVSPAAPPGALDARVTFTTQTGQTLVVPVLAYVTRNMAP